MLLSTLWLLPFAAMAFPTCPAVSPATGLANQFFTWKEGQQIRYQCSGPAGGEPIVLVHGLFVNSDHWRHSLKTLGDAGYRAYALDLWGCGYSDKPAAASKAAQLCNGENGRFDSHHPSILKNMELGTAKGGTKTRTVDIELTHPLGSPYNFFTWADLVNDFCENVVLSDDHLAGANHKDVTLVANSIGSITALQAVIDRPDKYKGVFVVCPNFRELHSAEVAFPELTMPVLRTMQKLLRDKGQVAYDALAKPNTVKQILLVPYEVATAVDDTLVEVLLDPLLTDGASKVVFDTLSYSAGPLPEQQLAECPKPVWICYGEKDPWTPGPRVEALKKYDCVERVDSFPGVGHCPHDEAPELVHPILFQFLERLGIGKDTI